MYDLMQNWREEKLVFWPIYDLMDDWREERLVYWPMYDLMDDWREESLPPQDQCKDDVVSDGVHPNRYWLSKELKFQFL